jgi:metallophosphoesterase (TIGR00282 family)
MRILFLGDIVGRGGRQMVADLLPGLRQELGLDLVLANGENASGGLGLSAKSAQELRRAGVDVLTTGNHVWKYPDIRPLLDKEPWLLRPANFPTGAPGKGMGLYFCREGMPPLVVINLQGRTFLDSIDCPFAAAERLVGEAPQDAIIVVDMHAEATSEKRALAHMLRGRVHAVVGTHTHVQTNDASILDGVTGFITDLGMCGPEDSCLGMDSAIILRKFQTGLPQRFELAKGPCMLNGAVIDVDDGRCRSISAWHYRASYQTGRGHD